MPYIDALKRYFDFQGRANRSQYWLFALVHVIVIVVLGLVDFFVFFGGNAESVADETVALFPITTIYQLAVLLPLLGVTARRLHDTGRSGWWQLIGFVPLIGAIVLIIFLVLPGDPEGNSHGEPPM